ncbi:MAG: AI-2E family transporter [Clostridia bacterium]
MTRNSYIKKKTKINDFIYLFIFIACGFFFIKYALPILLPIIIGAFIAIISRKFTIKIKLPRSFGIPLLLLFWGILSVFLYLLLFVVITSLINLSHSFPILKDGIINGFSALQIKYNLSFLLSFKDVLSDFLINLVMNLGKFLAFLISFMPNIILYIIVTIMTSFLTFIEYDKIVSALSKWRIFGKIKVVYSLVFKTFFSMVKAQSILYLIVLSLLFIGLFCLKIKNPFMVAFIISLVDLLPLIGLTFIMGVWGICLILLNNVNLGIMIILLSVIIFIIKEVLEPKIISSSIKISPLIVLVGAYLSYIIFGFIGLMISPFLISVLYIYLKNKDIISSL